MLQLDGREFFYHLQDKEDNAVKISQDFNNKIIAIQAHISQSNMGSSQVLGNENEMEIETLSDELKAITID